MVIDWKLLGSIAMLILAAAWLVYEWIMAREHDE